MTDIPVENCVRVEYQKEDLGLGFRELSKLVDSLQLSLQVSVKDPSLLSTGTTKTLLLKLGVARKNEFLSSDNISNFHMKQELKFQRLEYPIELKGFLAYSINAKIVLLPSREFF
jgi:hypothetical protein